MTDYDKLLAEFQQRYKEKGLTEKVRKKLDGKALYSATWDENKLPPHNYKMLFFRGDNIFLGSLPFWGSDIEQAWDMARQIAPLTGFKDARGVVGSPKNEKHQKPFQPQITILGKYIDYPDVYGEKYTTYLEEIKTLTGLGETWRTHRDDDAFRCWNRGRVELWGNEWKKAVDFLEEKRKREA